MTWRRTGLVAGAAAVLVLMATTGAVPELRLLVVAAVTGLLALGQRFREPGTTALGLLGLVTAVATGPAAAATTTVLLAWAVSTWAVVMSATAGLGPRWPPPRDARTRARVHAAVVVSCTAVVPLAVLATGGVRSEPGWAVGSAVVLLAGLLLAAAPAPVTDQQPGSGRADDSDRGDEA